MDVILAAARNKAGIAGWRNWGRSIIPQRFCRLLPSSSLTSRPLLTSHSLCNPADHGKDAGRISDPGFVQRLLFE